MAKQVFFQVILLLYVCLKSTLHGEPNRVVLVTGGAGYIGSHTCKALKEAGYLPVVYDSLALGEREAVKWGPLIVGDLLDVETLDKAFALYKPCAVLHFAALCNVGESVKDPSSYYTNNVIGSIHLLNAMHKHGVKDIIFSSSCTVYGDSTTLISEECPKAPTNPYAKSKYYIENVIKDYSYACQMHYMILRYFNAAGVDTEAGLRRSLHSCNFLIPRIMRSLLCSEGSLQIFGDDYPTVDGTCIRDYIHVKDLARAHVLALEYLQGRRTNCELNLGTGTGYSVLEIIRETEKITGKQVPYKISSRREGDVSQAVAKTSKAKEILDFEPQYSDLHTIIKSEWESIINR